VRKILTPLNCVQLENNSIAGNFTRSFQVEFHVSGEEANRPRQRLVQRLSQRRPHHVPRLQYVGTDRANPEGPLTLNLLCYPPTFPGACCHA